MCPLQHLAGRAVINGFVEIENPGIEPAIGKKQNRTVVDEKWPLLPIPERSKAESPRLAVLSFKKRISIKIPHFTPKPLLRTYCVLSVEDEEKERGMAK